MALQPETLMPNQSGCHDPKNHRFFMQLALDLAERGRGTTAPNPMVGCVIVTPQGEVIGGGYHHYAGGPHAEINALQTLAQSSIAITTSASAVGATCYVTLEPCAHHGKTPPCTNALIAAGISKVYVACMDPNPLVSGKGIEALRAAGIQVEVGLCAEEAKTMNDVFFHYITHKTPFVFAKWAMSLDGKTITHEKDSRQISGTEAEKLTHHLRREVDALIIGANTARDDNPQLTARPYTLCDASAKQPLRIILSSDCNLPIHLQLFADDLPGQTLIATTAVAMNKNKNQIAQLKNCEILVLPQNDKGQVDLHSLLRELGQREMTSVLVEGGMTVHQSFIAENLIQKIFVYIAPVIIGPLEKKQQVTILQNKQLMDDTIYEVKYV